MAVHITCLDGMARNSVAQIAQHVVADFACNDLNMNNMGIYFYNTNGESPKEQSARFDGIIASLSIGDTVIFQSPSWIAIEWDQAFIDHISMYPNVKKIIFIHDVVPLMFEKNDGTDYFLSQYVDFYNKADVLIVPSKQMYDYLRKIGLQEKPYVVQHFWDHPCDVDHFVTPQNNKVINFAGVVDSADNVGKFGFVNDWDCSDVKLQVFSNPKKQIHNNVEYMGYYYDPILVNKLRSSGGFGLVWSEANYWKEYMKLNTSYKQSTYLASGIPLIVRDTNPEAETIERKNLGLVVKDLKEAQEKVLAISDDDYQKMVESVDSFSILIKNGYFTKRALVDAVFKARYE